SVTASAAGWGSPVCTGTLGFPLPSAQQCRTSRNSTVYPFSPSAVWSISQRSGELAGTWLVHCVVMSDPLPGTGAEAAARIDQLTAAARVKAERYGVMRALAGQVSVSESSKDGVVTVTVDSAGNLTDLRITDKVRELSGAEVAAAVLFTLRTAQSRLP